MNNTMLQFRDPMANRKGAKRQAGFTVAEIVVGMTIGAFVLAGLYRLWSNNSEESLKLQRKIEIRNQVALSTKRLNQSITLAGIGLEKVVGLTKADAVGSDTLVVYTNASEHRTTLILSHHPQYSMVKVADGSIFANASYVVLTDGTNGEARRIRSREGSTLFLSENFNHQYAVATTTVMPATSHKFYSDQDREMLVCVVNAGDPSIVGRKIKNFQISFRDRNGGVTHALREIRFVNYSLTGVFPTREGAINSVVYSSTSIPRNIL